MKNYCMKKSTIPLDDSYDVIVIGGGPSGAAAAIAAAREGARTILFEATGCLGGMGTSGLIPAWCPFSDKEKIVYRGIAEKIFNAARAPMLHVKENFVNWAPIDAEVLKRVYDDFVTKAGVTILFNTFVTSVETDGAGSIDAVVVSNKAGLSAYSAKMFVDCSGDADVAVWAGAEYHKNADLQPATHCFIVSNVDHYAYKEGISLHSSNADSPAHKIASNPKYDLVLDPHMCNNVVGASSVGFNAGHIWDVDATDPESVTNALITGRKLAYQLWQGLREYHPQAFGGSHLESTAPSMGIRETRIIVGDYVFTVDDYLNRRSFDDEIARNCYYLDVHGTKEEATNHDRAKIESKSHRYNPGEFHGIPFRCLIPKGLKNVLVAGRSISSDRISQGTLRVMPTCLVTGEAAGCAAGMAAQENKKDIRELDVSNLRAKLKEYGAFIN